MTEQTLARARAGDEDAFREVTDPYRRQLHQHIYRIVGSVQDAEDLLQETLLAAWRGLERFEGRASVRAWLHRIATNRALDALRASRRRPEEAQRMTDMPEPTRRAEPIWLEPYPDVLIDVIPDEAPGPEARYDAEGDASSWRSSSAFSISRRSSARCSCCATCSASAPARSPRCSTPPSRRSTACCAARARRSSPACPPPDATGRRSPNSQLERDVVGRFADAVEAGDIDSIVALLTDDAWVTMPPEPWAYQGHPAISAFLRDREVRRGALLRLVQTRANTQPAFGGYLSISDTDIARSFALFVLTLEGDQISAITWFGDTSVFPLFGLPRTLR